jgi:hypothetical protein
LVAALTTSATTKRHTRFCSDRWYHPGRFNNGRIRGETFDVVTNSKGQTVVSDITSLAEEQTRSCLLTRCITKDVFPYYKFILLDSELDYGGRLQKRICGKLSVARDQQSSYWEMNREKVRMKLTRKRNNVTEAIRKKMTGK